MAIEFIRQTVATEVLFEGSGLHSGAAVKVRVESGSNGIQFNCGSERVEAKAENVTDTARCTRLGSVSTVEHLMSAFAGLGITDAEVVLTAPELPAMDGAAGEYARGVAAAGTVKLGRASMTLFERVFFSEESIRISVARGDGHWRFDFECGDRWPYAQSFECQLSPGAFVAEIAPARTFAFEEEVEPIRAAGLAKGLDASSALVLGADSFVNEPLWPDEPARHKLLDLLGDLYLSGVPPMLLNVVAVRSGHRTNVEAAKKLAEHVRIEK